MSEHYKYVSHTRCEYFPCHKGADPEHFNCLFCYCPLYVLGEHCGGQFTYTGDGWKDCSDCLLPHDPEQFDYVVGRCPEIARRMKRLREEEREQP